MNNKIIFFDIDGTLLVHNTGKAYIPESTKNTLKKLKENGHEVAIATGRSPEQMEDILRDLDISNFVSINGQYVKYSEEVIYDDTMDNNLKEEYIKIAKKYDLGIGFHGAHQSVVYNSKKEFVEKGLEILSIPRPEISNTKHKEIDTHQMWMFGEKANLENYINDNHLYDEKYYRWAETAMDIVKEHASKANGISKFIGHTGHKLENTYAFGDGNNDLEMLKYVGTGVAMGNAVDTLKEHADFITLNVHEDGIEHACKELGLI